MELRGHKVLLRPMRPSDITPKHIGWLNDAEVVRYSNQRFARHNRYTCRAYLGRFEGTANLYLSVRLADSDEAIGTITAYRSPQHGTADIGILMGERGVWGQGLGLDAFKTLADALATEPGLRKLSCGTLACNHAMIKIAERAGFEREAVRVAHEVVEGTPTDIIHFARFTQGVPATGHAASA